MASTHRKLRTTERKATKFCSQCRLTKRRFDFYRRTGRDGLQSMCKQCTKRNDTARVIDGRQRLKCRKWYAKVSADHRWKAREKIRRNKWRQNNAGIHRASNRRHYLLNPSQYYDRVMARHAALRGTGGSHTTKQWKALCDASGNICLRCHKHTVLVRDHIIPISRGGSGYITNIQPLCSLCNARKYTKHIDYRTTKLISIAFSL